MSGIRVVRIHRHVAGQERHVLEPRGRLRARVRLDGLRGLDRLRQRVDVVAADGLERVGLRRRSRPSCSRPGTPRSGSRASEAVGGEDRAVDGAAARVGEQRRVVAVGRENGVSTPGRAERLEEMPRSRGRRSARRSRRAPGRVLDLRDLRAELGLADLVTCPRRRSRRRNAGRRRPRSNVGMSFVYGISGEPSVHAVL